MEPLINSLNPAQKEAAETIDRHVRIVAGAGSGKTRVLMARIEYLLDEIGVYPNRILAITFTNKAANEMKERLKAQVGDLAKDVRISTIHALCVRILKEDARAAGYPSNFTILDPEDQKRILKTIYDQHHIDKTEISMPNALGYISNNKTAGISPLGAKKQAWTKDFETKAMIYEEYEKAKDEMRAMDFDDLLLNADRLLKNNEHVRTKWQNRLDYLHVDEFQDVDPNQYSIIKSLTREDAVLCVVGDPDQTIYSWRGADVNLMLDFNKDFRPSHTVILNENYRSTTPILGASNAVIANNEKRIKKDLHTSISSENLLVLHGEDNEEDESIFVARQISELHKNGMPYEDMAILYRNNYCSRAFEKKLEVTGIPYQVYGGIRFYERMEIKDMLSYLKLITPPAEDDPQAKSHDLAFMRVINQPRRGIGAKTVDKIAAYAKAHDINMLEAARQGAGLSAASARKVQQFVSTIEDLQKEAARPDMNFVDLIDIILDYSGYDKMVKAAKEEERLDNIRELQEDIRSALQENPSLTLDQYLQNVSLFTDRQEQEEDKKGVRLMTVHASKGTEYPAVFISQFCDEIFPSKRSLEESGRQALEEERRLLYVAMTRAKERLFITWNTGKPFYSNDFREPSRFLQEIPEEFVEKPKEKAAPVLPESLKPTPRTSPYSKSRGPRKKVKTIHYRKGDLIDHAVYGEGRIVSLAGDVGKIMFPEPIGLKTMNVQHSSIKPKKGS